MTLSVETKDMPHCFFTMLLSSLNFYNLTLFISNILLPFPLALFLLPPSRFLFKKSYSHTIVLLYHHLFLCLPQSRLYNGYIKGTNLYSITVSILLTLQLNILLLKLWLNRPGVPKEDLPASLMRIFSHLHSHASRLQLLEITGHGNLALIWWPYGIDI